MEGVGMFSDWLKVQGHVWTVIPSLESLSMTLATGALGLFPPTWFQRHLAHLRTL